MTTATVRIRCVNLAPPSGVEQQRGEGRVHGPGGVVRVAEGLPQPTEASAEERRTQRGRRDARKHRPEGCHGDSAHRHLTSPVKLTEERLPPIDVPFVVCFIGRKEG